MNTSGSRSSDLAKEWKPADLAPILEALRGVRYGSVEVFIQDYRVVQIDRKEKIRSFKNQNENSPTGSPEAQPRNHHGA